MLGTRCSRGFQKCLRMAGGVPSPERSGHLHPERGLVACQIHETGGLVSQPRQPAHTSKATCIPNTESLCRLNLELLLQAKPLLCLLCCPNSSSGRSEVDEEESSHNVDAVTLDFKGKGSGSTCQAWLGEAARCRVSWQGSRQWSWWTAPR